MKKLTEEASRNLNGGKPYCKICGYTNNSELCVKAHVIAKHPAVILRMMWMTGTTAVKAAARLVIRC